MQILHNSRGQEVHGSYINGLKGSYLQFHTLYHRICEVTTDFCSINLVEEKQTRHQEILFLFMTHFMGRRIKKVRMTQALTGHYVIIFVYCKLKSVSFQKLVLPHNIGKSLHTFLKGGFISLKLY